MPPTPLRDNLNDMAARTTRAAEKARIDAARRKADEKVRAQRRAADARSAAFEARKAVATFRCRGDGLRRCVNGRRASFAIDAPHRGLAFFAALESATHRYELDVVEEDGTYACSYVVAAPPGPYELSVLLDDEVPLPGSPFSMNVAAGAPSALVGSNEAAPGERVELAHRERIADDRERAVGADGRAEPRRGDGREGAGVAAPRRPGDVGVRQAHVAHGRLRLPNTAAGAADPGVGGRQEQRGDARPHRSSTLRSAVDAAVAKPPARCGAAPRSRPSSSLKRKLNTSMNPALTRDTRDSFKATSSTPPPPPRRPRLAAQGKVSRRRT